MKFISNENRHLGLSNNIKFVKNGDHLHPLKPFGILILKSGNSGSSDQIRKSLKV